VARRLNPAITSGEVGQGVAREEAWTKGDSIRGFAQREAHQRSHPTVTCVDGEEALVTGRRSGQCSRRSSRGGAPWRRGTHSGVGEQSEEAAIGGVLTGEDNSGQVLDAGGER
jgi:hypothetical protein